MKALGFVCFFFLYLWTDLLLRKGERTNFIKSSSMARRLFSDTVRSGYEINIEVQRAESHRVIPELLSSTHLPPPPPPKERKKEKKKDLGKTFSQHKEKCTWFCFVSLFHDIFYYFMTVCS